MMTEADSHRILGETTHIYIFSIACKFLLSSEFTDKKGDWPKHYEHADFFKQKLLAPPYLSHLKVILWEKHHISGDRFQKNYT